MMELWWTKISVWIPSTTTQQWWQSWVNHGIDPRHGNGENRLPTQLRKSTKSRLGADFILLFGPLILWLTATKWNITIFPSQCRIHCVAPNSNVQHIRIATIVVRCGTAAVRIQTVVHQRCTWHVRCTRCPCLARPSAHCHTESSYVLMSSFSLFAICIK